MSAEDTTTTNHERTNKRFFPRTGFPKKRLPRRGFFPKRATGFPHNKKVFFPSGFFLQVQTTEDAKNPRITKPRWRRKTRKAGTGFPRRQNGRGEKKKPGEYYIYDNC